MTDKQIDPSLRIALWPAGMSINQQENIAKACDAVRAAKKSGADLLVLPELFCNQYFCINENDKYFGLAQSLDGDLIKSFRKAAKAESICVVVPFFEKGDDGRYYNCAVTIDADGEIAGRYRKTHIPYDPLFYEKFYFSPSDNIYEPVDLGFIKLGVLICYDQWFSEPARILALKGAELIVYPSAIGRIKGESEQEGFYMRDSWQAVQRGHAISNGIFVAGLNRAGMERSETSDDYIDFFGGTFCYDPFGQKLAMAGDEQGRLILADIDRSLIRSTRKMWPFMRDRRPGLYRDVSGETEK